MEAHGQDLIVAIARGGFQGRGQRRGRMGPGCGRGQLVCYNYGGPGHYALDCMNLTRAYCPYCYHFDHEAVDFPMLISQMREKGVLLATPT